MIKDTILRGIVRYFRDRLDECLRYGSDFGTRAACGNCRSTPWNRANLLKKRGGKEIPRSCCNANASPAKPVYFAFNTLLESENIVRSIRSFELEGRRMRFLQNRLIVLITVIVIGLTGFPRGSSRENPNIVLIISDDQKWTDFGFMGHPVIQTPHLDRLSEEGILYSRGYVPVSLCRPSLASIITGLYSHQHRITGNDPYLPEGSGGRAEYLRRNEQIISRIEHIETLPRLLAEKGYLSFQSGKWWEGHFSRGGFTHGMTHGDAARGGRHGDEGLEIGRSGLDPIFDFWDRAGDQPVFIWYAPFLPHTPHTPPERLLDKYRAENMPVEISRYYAMCEWFDETVGDLLDYT